MWKIFVSSTWNDLQAERLAVREAISRLGCGFVGMEHFGSSPTRPLDSSLRFLETCNLYIGILAHRYGSIDDESGKSITQLEYERARELGIPVLMYDKSFQPVTPSEVFLDFDHRMRSRLQMFRNRIRSEVTLSEFSSSDNLAAKVTADLAKLWIGQLMENRQIAQPAETIIVPMVGPPAVGKTVYWSMLLHEPISYIARRSVVLELRGGSDRLFRAYEDLVCGGWPCPSSAGRSSPVELYVKRSSVFRNREYTFKLVDNSGEEFRQPYIIDRYDAPQSQWLKDLPESSGIALFFAAGTQFRAETADQEYVSLLRILASRGKQGKFRKPVAIILTKCDLESGLFDEKSVEKYIRSNFPEAWNGIGAFLDRFKLFATSATGTLNADGNPQELKPLGLWDPLLWLAASI